MQTREYIDPINWQCICKLIIFPFTPELLNWILAMKLASYIQVILSNWVLVLHTTTRKTAYLIITKGLFLIILSFRKARWQPFTRKKSTIYQKNIAITSFCDQCLTINLGNMSSLTNISKVHKAFIGCFPLSSPLSLFFTGKLQIRRT